MTHAPVPRRKAEVVWLPPPWVLRVLDVLFPMLYGYEMVCVSVLTRLTDLKKKNGPMSFWLFISLSLSKQATGKVRNLNRVVCAVWMWVVFGSCSSKGIQRKKQGSVGTKIKLCSVSRSPAGCVFNQEGWILRMRGKDFGRCGVRCGMVVSFSFFVRYFYAASTGGVRKQNKSLSAWAIRISKGGYIEMIHGWLFLKHWRNEYPTVWNVYVPGTEGRQELKKAEGPFVFSYLVSQYIFCKI